MNFRKYIYAVSFIAAGMSLSACSNVDEDERFIEIEPEVAAKRVLIEDFTGQDCINCPTASTVIEQIQEAYGAENIIAVGIHSGHFGQNTPLLTETGDYYYKKWGVRGQPTGMIDRHGLVSNPNLWMNIVKVAIGVASPLKLEGECSYDDATRKASITVNAEALDNVDGILQVWLVEDGIVSYQKMVDGSTNHNYVHNHVFRAAVNDKDGEPFTMAFNEKKDITFEAVIDRQWKAENMSAVAFVANDEDGVVQTVRIPLTKTADEQ